MPYNVVVSYPDATGATNLYTLAWDADDSATVLNISTKTWVTYVEANRDTLYGINLTEIVAGARQYGGNVPSGTPARRIKLISYLKAGATKAGSDDIIYDEVPQSWNGTKFLGLSDIISSVADPLLNQVPGTYAQGTAGAALGKVATGQLTIVSPVAQNGVLSLVQGDDYPASRGRQLEWTGSSASWPDLTGATITLNVDDGRMIVAGSVITPTGATRKVRVEPTSTDTNKLGQGQYLYTVLAQFTGTALYRVTLAAGICYVTDREDS